MRHVDVTQKKKEKNIDFPFKITKNLTNIISPDSKVRHVDGVQKSIKIWIPQLESY